MKSFIQYINEVKQADIESHALEDKIDSADEGDFDNYNFNNIFGNKLRIIVPFLGQEMAISEKQIEHQLEQEGFSVDFKKGTATNKKTNQSMKLGKLLRRLSKKNDYLKKALHWWEMRQDPTKKMGEGQGVSIIISRSPIDIIRMSDHRELQSCHSPPGRHGHISSYWSCAGQEARTGGAIAYVVRNRDLQNLSNIQAREIFQDYDRDIEGVEPLERVRLRRFTAHNYDKSGFDVVHEDPDPGTEDPKDKKRHTIDILIPEERTYGTRHIDFLESVIAWAKKVQSPYISFTNPPDWKLVQLHGGTYRDTDSSQLWNDFFGTNESGNKSSVDKKSEEKHGGPDSGSIYDRAQEQIEAHDFKHIWVTAEVEEQDDIGAYISSHASIGFPFDKQLIIKNPEKDFHDYRGETRRSLMHLFDFTISDIYIDSNGPYITFNFDIEEEDGSYRANNENDRFESFLDTLDYIDGDYNKSYLVLKRFLIEHGYIKKNVVQFTNFEIDENEEDSEADVTSKYMFVGFLEGISQSTINTEFVIDGFSRINPMHHGEPFSKMKVTRSIKLNPSVIFPQFDFLVDHIYLYAKKTLHGPAVFLRIYFTLNQLKYQQQIEALKHIDENWGIYQKRAMQWWQKIKPTLMSNDPKDPNISHVGPTIQTGGEVKIKEPQITVPIPKDRPPSPYVQQRLFDFKDWLIISELPII